MHGAYDSCRIPEPYTHAKAQNVSGPMQQKTCIQACKISCVWLRMSLGAVVGECIFLVDRGA